MNFSKVVIAFILACFVPSLEAARPGGSEAYLLFTRSDFIRNQLTNRALYANKAVLKKRIQNAKLRAALAQILNIDSQQPQQQQVAGAHQQSAKATSRMNRFRRFHH